MHEQPLLLRWAMYHFPGGDGFLCGLLVAVLAQVGLIFIRHERWRRLLVVAFRVGLIWSVAIPSPTPRWLIALFVMSLLWLWLAERQAKSASDAAAQSGSAMLLRRLRWLVVGLMSIAVMCELPYRFAPVVEFSSPRLSIVADSVTAGLNDGENTWPKRLARSSHWQITDAAQAGATLKSARRQLDRLGTEPSILLLEIGGNDALAGLPVAEFEQDFEQLLLAACQPGRTVLMFELPLPPLGFRYGETQRRLATKYGVSLFPKRLLMRVLTTPGASVDGVHLSSDGHAQMAVLVGELLAGSGDSKDEAGSYQDVGGR